MSIHEFSRVSKFVVCFKRECNRANNGRWRFEVTIPVCGLDFRKFLPPVEIDISKILVSGVGEFFYGESKNHGVWNFSGASAMHRKKI